jgi:hypothetical protein
MPYPTAIVEISFASTPYTASPTWVDVTSYVREITTRRGRRDEFQDFGSGTATVVLDNRDRRFDPLNTASPYNGQLTPRRQIRIRAVTTSSPLVTQDVFRGYISGWPVSITDAGFDSTVTVECFDALGLLDTEEIPDDLADTYIRSLSPRHYWPLTDPIDPQTYTTAQLADYGSSPQVLTAYPPFPAANAEGLAPGLPDTSLLVAQTFFTEGYWFQQPGIAATDTTFATWYVQGQTEDNWQITNYGLSHEVQVGYNRTTSKLELGIYNGTSQRLYEGNLYIDPTIPHHIAIITTSASLLSAAYVDGIAVTMAQTSLDPAFPITVYETYMSSSGKKQQTAMWTRALTATEIQTIYRLGRNVLTETTSARFNRIIGYSSFPAGLTSATASPVASVGAFTTGGPTIASELEVVSDSEGGNLYVNKAGVVVMTSRHEFATGTSLTSQATIGTTGISIGTSLDYQIDAENMRNQLAIGYSGEGSIEITDTASRDAYGIAGGSITTQLVSQQDATSLGNFIVGFSKDPAVVISPVEVNVSAVAADWDTVLGLELLERITLTVQPRTGASFTQQQLLQSIEHRVIPGQWSTTFNGSVRFTNPFIVGVSLLGGSDLLV